MFRSCHVFCDVDGVLADFTGAALHAHGWRPAGVGVGVRDDERVEVDRWSLWECLGISEAAFWSPIDQSVLFWSDMDLTSEAARVLLLLERYAGTSRGVCLLTEPRPTMSSHAGRWHWIRQWLPDYADRYLMGRPKAACAARGCLLLDDNDANVQAFRDAGGWAILWPRPWNSRRDLTHRACDVLADDLRRLEMLSVWHDD